MVRLAFVTFALTGHVFLGGCGQSAEECVVDPDGDLEPPAAPSVIAPTSGRLDIDPATVVFETAPPDAEVTHLETEAEIWRVAGGEPIVRVWSATFEPDLETGAVPGSFSLDDGAFEGISETTGLLDWEDYGLRVRHRILEPGAGCSRFTAFSDTRVFRTDDGSSHLYDDSQILDIELTIGPESFDAINAEARPPGCVPFDRDYHTADAVIDGVSFDGVGLRSKGGCGSARPLDQKAAFKINLSWDDPAIAGCAETRRIYGQKRLTINNMVQDRSFIHERIGYDFYKLMGVPTPRAAHVRLAVNGEHWGLYLNVESIERRMLSRWFESSRGMLYEGTYFCDLVPQNVPEAEDDDTMCLERKFKDDICDGSPDPGDDPKTYAPLRDFVTAVDALPDGEFYPAIRDLVDFDEFLSLWAADSIMGHWDGYGFDIINNYRVYHHPLSDNWSIIPTGIDQTFDRDQDPFAVQGILAVRCLSEPSCEQAFIDRLREGLVIFESADLVERVEAIHAQIAAEVEADPRKPGSVGDYDNARTRTIDFINGRAEQIRSYITARGF